MLVTRITLKQAFYGTWEQAFWFLHFSFMGVVGADLGEYGKSLYFIISIDESVRCGGYIHTVREMWWALLCNSV